jgi:UDP-GlcNAc:undecaprenyl-phosphate/decaprenyl-phosphate GlcNAc-1-phosphate transferase
MTLGLLTFSIALVTSLVITLPVRQFAIRVGMVDHPGPRKIHLQPVPLLGGIAIYFAVILALLLSKPGEALSKVLAIAAAATLLLLVGTFDDRGLLHHQVKLFLAMPLAGVIVFLCGIHAQIFSTLLPGRFSPIMDAALTVLWITGITASFSILDYMDGLCAGIAAVSSLFLGILAILNGQVLSTMVAAAVTGAALGFLRWNFSPAKIFMGDGGAMLLGFLAATSALELRANTAFQNAGWLAPVLVLAVPIFDTTLVSISRLRRGLVPFTSPGKDHAAHRLANSGLSTRASVVIMYAIGFTFGLLAILSTRFNSGQLVTMAVVLSLGFTCAIAIFERLPYEQQPSRSESPS